MGYRHVERSITGAVVACASVAALTVDASMASAEGAAQPVTIEVVYKGDAWHNAVGGLHTGNAYIDNLDVNITVDGEEAFGVPGLELFANGLYNNGGRLSEELVGDAMVVSNIDSPYAVRLYEAWADWRPGGGGPLSMRAGFYDLNTEFDIGVSRQLFLHSTHGVGQDLAQVGPLGPSIFPSTGLALRAAWEIARSGRLQLAAIDGVPAAPDSSPRERVHLDSEEGALLVGELQFLGTRVSKGLIGTWYHTGTFNDILDRDAPRSHHGNSGIYGLVDFRLGGMWSEESSDVTAFVRYGVVESRTNEFDQYLGIGVRGRGVWTPRPADEMGVAVAIGRVSNAARGAAEMAGDLRDRYETAIELTWRAPINDWLTLQPDIQYIINPGTYQSARDALVVGMRVEMAHRW